MSIPPIVLVLDVSTLTKTDIRDWLGFSRAGTCLVPQTVFEEMRFLYDRSPDADLERVSREFNRFYASSGWQITDASGHHPLLKSSSGRALTRRVRVALAVARCAYGVAQQSSHSLVVLVASDESILQRIEDVRTANLTAITSADLLQWSRSGQRPAEVQKKLQAMRSANLSQSRVAVGVADTPRPPVRNSPRETSTSGSHRMSSDRAMVDWAGDRNRDGRHQSRRQPKHQPHRLSAPPSHRYIKRQGGQLLALLTALGAVIFAGVIMWALFSTTYFDRFLPSPSPNPEAPS
ncbi:MAG: PIN domain-containing protein [Cyanobacteria bacterium P01_A01_bin.135]